MAVIGSVITWIAHPVSSLVHKGLGLAAHTVKEASDAVVCAPIPPQKETRAEAILSGCSAIRRSPTTATIKATATAATATATTPPRDSGHPRAASNSPSDKGRLPPGPARSSVPAQPIMNRSRPTSRRQSNVGGSGNSLSPDPQCSHFLAR